MYPVRIPLSLGDDGTYPGVVPLLLRYEMGGLLILIERTLWWSPDYGAAWQKLETWSEPPCDRSIVGTPDLSVLYCVAWNGEQRPHPYWRSVDHGQTWAPVPAEPLATSAASGVALPRLAPPLVLRDGSLLEMAVIPGSSSGVAYYSLAPNANVWTQASPRLNDVLSLCPQPTPEAASTSLCIQAISTTLTNGPSGRQYLYQARSNRLFSDGASGGEDVVGEITWN